MRKSVRFLLGALSAVTLGSALSGCYVHEREYERDREGRAYRHQRWNNEDIYRREDGRWYARRNGEWFMIQEVRVE